MSVEVHTFYLLGVQPGDIIDATRKATEVERDLMSKINDAAAALKSTGEQKTSAILQDNVQNIVRKIFHRELPDRYAELGSAECDAWRWYMPNRWPVTLDTFVPVGMPEDVARSMLNFAAVFERLVVRHGKNLDDDCALFGYKPEGENPVLLARWGNPALQKPNTIQMLQIVNTRRRLDVTCGTYAGYGLIAALAVFVVGGLIGHQYAVPILKNGRLLLAEVVVGVSMGLIVWLIRRSKIRSWFARQHWQFAWAV